MNFLLNKMVEQVTWYMSNFLIFWLKMDVGIYGNVFSIIIVLSKYSLDGDGLFVNSIKGLDQIYTGIYL